MSLEALGLENGLPFINIETDEEAYIPFRPNNKAEEYLGVFTRPDGSQINEFQDLMKISIMFRGIFTKNKLTKYQAKTLYASIWFPMMQYSLAATRLTKAQCEELMKPVHVRQIAFARMGFNRNIAPEIMHGPLEFGYDLRDFYTEQGIDGITQFIGHMRAQDKLGQLMEALLSHVQLYSGYGTMSILETCKIPIEYVPDSWIMHLRNFLSTLDGKIHIPNVWLPLRRRENDSFIMEEVNLLPLSTPNKRRVNDCRLYLGAITKSDLVTADGTELDMRLLEGKRRIATTLIFPDRPSPPATSWKIFRSTMRRLYAKHRKGKMPKRLRLEYPMGPWYQIQHHAWDTWMLDEGKNILYERDETKRCLNVLKYAPDQRGYSRTGASTRRMPKLAVPVKTVESNVVKLIGHRPSLPLPCKRDAETAEMSLKEKIACQPDHIRRMIGDVDVPDDEFEEIANALAKGFAILVSDGAVAKKRAAHAWKIAVNDADHEFAAAAGPCDAEPESITSYRAELTGICGGMAFALLLLRHHHLTMPDNVKLTVYCDNESAVTTVSVREFLRGVKAHTTAEHDVIFEIRSMLDAAGVGIKAKHVKGHQDSDKQYDELPFPARMNVDCDKLAGDFLRNPPARWEPRCSAPIMNQVALSIAGVTMTSNLANGIRRKIHGDRLKQYIIKKEQRQDPGWSEFDFDSIDWESMRIALKREKPGRVRRILKFQHHWLPTAERMYGSTASKQCPACKDEENQQHLLRCKASVSVTNVKLQLQILRRSLRKIHVLPSIWQTIEEELLYALGHSDSKLSPTFLQDAAGRNLQRAWVDQQNIGWINMIKGRISPYWGIAQNQCYLERFPEKDTLSAQVFQIRLIRGMWLLFEGVWFQRNAILHHADDSVKSQACDKKIRQYIKRKEALVDAHDLPLFKTFKRREYRDLPLATKERWIEQVELAIKSRHGTLDVPEALPITHYFSPTPTATDN